MTAPAPAILAVPCADLTDGISLLEDLGFRLDAIGPADEPTWAELSGPGTRIRLEEGSAEDVLAGPQLLVGGPVPTGHGLGLAIGHRDGGGPTDPGRPDVPDTRHGLAIGHEADGSWKEGRAGMRYRDLIPDRHGGAYIASHIHVPGAGPVADYVHHHDIVHQLIFCHRGRVRVVYQDQGPPFWLEPGDCVLQPPGIRHRVLETAEDLYVVEIGCPARHRTSVDHELALPNQALEPDRRYGGQHFVRHRSAEAPWTPAPDGPPGGRASEQVTGLAAATGDLVSARLVRIVDPGPGGPWELGHDRDLRLLFVASGSAVLHDPGNDGAAGGPVPLVEGSSVSIPPGSGLAIGGFEPDTVLFEVTAAAPTGGR